MNVIRGNRPELEQSAAGLIADNINSLLKEKEFIIIAIPGGRSVSGIFEDLKKLKIPWNKVHIFMVDERMVPITDSESNFKLANDNFIKDINIPEQNVHPFILENGISAYQQELQQFQDHYDIILLSSGEDGHVGCLYPNHHSIDDDSDFFIQMDDSPKPPPDRMGISRKMLLKSKTAIILFFGEAKKQALDKFNSNIQYKECPAVLVKEIETFYVLTDLN